MGEVIKVDFEAAWRKRIIMKKIHGQPFQDALQAVESFTPLTPFQATAANTALKTGLDYRVCYECLVAAVKSLRRSDYNYLIDPSQKHYEDLMGIRDCVDNMIDGDLR